MTRALITGGTGFIGANLARRLIRDGHETHLLVREQSNCWRIEEIRDSLHLHLADSRQLAAIVRDIAPQWVFHLAAYGSYPQQTEFDRMMETNVLYTAQLVEACLAVGFQAFVAAGSSSEYGFKDHAPGEDEIPQPNSPYAVTKLAATTYCGYAARRTGAHITVLRLYSVYGPFENPARFIPRLIIEAMRNHLPPLADPDSAHDFIYIDDVCDAFLAAASSRCDPILNVGTGAQTTLREAVNAVVRLLPVGVSPKWGTMTSRAWDTSSWKSDISRIRRIGWVPRTSFPDGIARMIEWLRERPEMLELYSGASQHS